MIQEIIIQVLLGIVFLFLTLLNFTFVGGALLQKIGVSSKDTIEKYFLSSCVGFVIFTLLAYLLAFLHLRYLMWILPLLGIYFFIKNWKLVQKFDFNITKKYRAFFWIVLIIGIIGQVAVNAPSGFTYSDGIDFYSSHGHDGVWHISLMREMQKDIFPFQNPEYAGHKLQNYHFFVDLLMSEMSRLYHFSELDVYFRFMPIFFSVLLGLGSFLVVKIWTKGKDLAGIWAMIFTYFCGSFGYVLTLPKGQLGGESAFWVSQTQSVLGNPPHASAFIIMLGFIIFLYKFLEEKTWRYVGLATLLGGAIIEFKVYAGLLILGGLGVLFLWNLVFERSLKLAILFVSTLILALGIYLPNSVNSQDFLIWQPWWYIRTMSVSPDRLNWLDIELRRQTYIAQHNIKRVIEIETILFLIFLFGNLGMRFLWFWKLFLSVKSNIFKKPFDLFLISMISAAFFIPVFFLQKGVAWNSIQFEQYFLLLTGVVAGVAVDDLFHRIKPKFLTLIIGVIIVILAVPTQIGLLNLFYSNKPLSNVSFAELDAMNYIHNHSPQDAVILTAPFDLYAKDKYSPPVPIYSWYDTGYVSYFTDRNTLISDSEQINIMGYQDQTLLDARQAAFDSTDPKVLNQFLANQKIDLVYLVYDQKFKADPRYVNLKLVYQNHDARVYQVI